MWVLLFPFVILTVVIGLFVVIGVYSWQKEKERTRQLQLTASQLGWSFAASAPLGMIAGLEHFDLFIAARANFIPAQKDGRFVSMYIQLEYNFNVY